MTPDQFDRFSAEQRAAQIRAGLQAAATVARIRNTSKPAPQPVPPKAMPPAAPQPHAPRSDRGWMLAGLLLCLILAFGLGLMVGRLACTWGLAL